MSGALHTSLWVLAGSTGRVSSTVASKVLSAKPTSYEKKFKETDFNNKLGMNG